nr:hypothetical protein [Lactobacillus sp. ESL0225]
MMLNLYQNIITGSLQESKDVKKEVIYGNLSTIYPAHCLLIEEEWKCSRSGFHPSNIFTTTGINVSLIFIDKGRKVEQAEV